MFRIVTIPETERALLLRAGRAVRWLEPGVHWLWEFGQVEVRRIDVDKGFVRLTPELTRVMPPHAADVLDVPENHRALVRREGLAFVVLTPGRWALFRERHPLEAELVSTEPVFATSVPQTFVPLMQPSTLREIAVEAWERAVLMIDGQVHDVLAPGRHRVFVEGRSVAHHLVDLRERELAIPGQEVMTADKASIRATLIVRHRVTDALRATTATDDLRGALHTEAQLVARRWIAGHTLDQLLERRHEAARDMRAELSARAEAWGVEVAGLDLKDLILPGDMRTILNQVLEAEKRASANVILRREETAATRSLANTAKLLAESPTLMRLKELEAWKDIAERVGHISVVASPAEFGRVLALPGGSAPNAER